MRNFYLVTNGWRETGYYIYDILPVEKIEWLQILDLDLYNIAYELEEMQTTSNEYRYQQGTQVKRSLAISSWEDGAMWLLDLGEKDAQGEWAGGCWASWNPAMKWKAMSFAELMKQQLESFIGLRDD